jgi:hypothetical protein
MVSVTSLVNSATVSDATLSIVYLTFSPPTMKIISSSGDNSSRNTVDAPFNTLFLMSRFFIP